MPTDFYGRVMEVFHRYGMSMLQGAGTSLQIALVGTLAGCIIGFAVGTYVTGTLAWRREKPGFGYLLASSLLGLGIIYLFGLIYYSLISRLYLGTPIGLWPLFVHGCLLTLPGDIALSVLGAVLGKRLIPLLRQKGRAL